MDNTASQSFKKCEWSMDFMLSFKVMEAALRIVWRKNGDRVTKWEQNDFFVPGIQASRCPSHLEPPPWSVSSVVGWWEQLEAELWVVLQQRGENGQQEESAQKRATNYSSLIYFFFYLTVVVLNDYGTVSPTCGRISGAGVGGRIAAGPGATVGAGTGAKVWAGMGAGAGTGTGGRTGYWAGTPAGATGGIGRGTLYGGGTGWGWGGGTGKG